MSSAHSKKSYTCSRGYTVPILLQWSCRLTRSICRPIGHTKFYFDRCSWTQAIKNVSFPSICFVVLLLHVKLEPPSLFSQNSLVVLHTNHLRFSVLKLSKILVLFGQIEPFPVEKFGEANTDHVPRRCLRVMSRNTGRQNAIFSRISVGKDTCKFSGQFFYRHDNDQQSFAFQQYSELIQSIFNFSEYFFRIFFIEVSFAYFSI